MKINLIALLFISLVLPLFATGADHPLNGAVNNKCSGSIVQLGRSDNAKAVVLTNGHCLLHRTLPPESFIAGKLYQRSPMTVFGPQGNKINLTPRAIIYGTMTVADVGLVEVNETYAELKAQGIRVFELASKIPAIGTKVTMMSGYWSEVQTCTIERVVPVLKEASFTWPYSFVLNKECVTKPGWSGSPIISETTGKVIGVLNTGYNGGAPCALNNPCEVNANNTVSVGPHSYGQFTALIWSCLNQGNLDLHSPRCQLFNKRGLPFDAGISVKQKLSWLNHLAAGNGLSMAISETATNLATSKGGNLYYNDGVLDSFGLLELLTYACHEIGHHKGTVWVPTFSGLANEAESDYFGGGCLKNLIEQNRFYLQTHLRLYPRRSYSFCQNDESCNEISTILTESYGTLFGVHLNAANGAKEVFENGINNNYPSPDCRAWSAISGAMGLNRPVCWYNPK